MKPLDTSKPTAPILLDKKVEQDRTVFSFQVPQDLAYFEGHFQKVAVVAGVVQLKWVKDVILEHFGVDLSIRGMEAVKFHHLLLPEQIFEMSLKHDETRNKWIYQLTSEGKKIASGRFLSL